MNSSRQWPRLTTTALLTLLLLGATLAVYANSFHVPFLLDDEESILNNPTIRRLAPSALKPPENAGVGGRPLANLSFALNYATGGTMTTGYHVVNLVIHLAAALVLFGLIRRTLAGPVVGHSVPEGRRAVLAGAVALLWVVHPLLTEAVTYISQRTECLVGLFYLLTIYGFIRGAETRSPRWLALSVVSATAGAVTKEIIVTAPVVVFLFDRTFFAGSFRAAWRERRWYYLALTVPWLVLAAELSGISVRGVGYARVAWWQYGLTEAHGLLHYVRLAAWPNPLVFDYGLGFIANPAEAIGWVLLVIVFIAGVLYALWRRPIWGFLGAWFFIVLSPTSSIVPVAGQPIAEHRMYLPLAALAVALVFGCERFVGRWMPLFVTVLACAFGVLAHARNHDYRTARDIWYDTIAKNPTSGRAWSALGAVLVHEHDLARAVPVLRRAIQFEPRDAEAHNNLAVALSDTGHVEDAITESRISVRLDPSVANTHYNLGRFLLDAGRPADAAAALQRAIALNPELAPAHAGLGAALLNLGRPAEALPHYVRALQLDPTIAAAQFATGIVLAQLNRGSEALLHFDAAIRLMPTSPEIHFTYGDVLLALQRLPDAIREYEAALHLRPDFPEAHNNLATALVRSGQLAEGRAHYETALKLKPDFELARRNLEDLKQLMAQPR